MGGNLPGGNLPGGNSPGGSLMGGNFPGGYSPGGNFPDTVSKVGHAYILPHLQIQIYFSVLKIAFNLNDQISKTNVLLILCERSEPTCNQYFIRVHMRSRFFRKRGI